MRISRTLATAALAALALTGAAVTPAQAAGAVLTTGSPTGPAVAVGDVLTANLVSGTTANFNNSATGSTGVKCAASSFSATVTANPAAPGSAVERLDTQTFGSCTSNVIGVTGVKSVTVTSLPFTNTVSDAPGNPVKLTPGAAGVMGTTVVLNTILGSISCNYQNSTGINGTTSNTGNTIGFAGQPFALVSGPSLCFSTGYFSATYGPVLDSSVAGSPALFVN
ncbi:Tat pathway signal sequence domain protein [Kitasatospora xanthocidica]|uniref:Tat pathway signal sequence domain protein n=1 Tax=Kitasatospora xanthocidica TaxID=83382 RepID=A0A372ZQC9_9ACTN|nr:Tat pathway signal sequence domain protein [Kitasatospora xanthocidica]RGD57941.1 Tat pathway signal sequence domain protein [Kitasatospora xanthocidica]